MPLMVDPSSGAPLYNHNASIFTFMPSPTSTPLATATGSVVVAAIASASSSTQKIPEYNRVNMTEVLKDQAAQQAGMDSTTPRNLMISFAVLLLVCILVAHPRFLARLFASLPIRDTSKTRRKSTDSPFTSPSHHTITGHDTISRVVGGGGLNEGWILRKGEPRAMLSSPLVEKLDPFSSSVDELSLHTPPTPPPSLYSPPHIAPLISHLPFSSTLLLAPFSRLPNPFATSATMIQIYFIAAYLALTALALIWKSDITPTTKTKGYGNDFARSGLVALTQVPLVVALGVRGNLIGLCVGKGYERLKIFHKVVGRVMFLAATLHMAFFLHKWHVAGMLSKYSSKHFIICGYVAWGSMVLIVLTSIPWIRKACYGVFEVCHFVGMVGMLVGMCFHVDVAVPFCVSALVIYSLSIISSLTKTRLAHAELVALPGASTTLITIPALRTGWRAGQHVRLRVPALGFPRGVEAHPFTIASAPDGEGMVLMCKKAGNWTEKLYELAAGGGGSVRLDDPGVEKSSTVSVILEGPYGGLGNTLLPSFSSVVLVAGGSGITHALSLANDLISRAPTGVVRARTVDLIWMVRTEDAAKPLIPSLLDLVNDAKAWEVQCLKSRRQGQETSQPTALRVTIHVTRCPTSSPMNLLTPVNPFASDRDDVLEDLQIPPGSRRLPSEADQEKYAYLSRNPSSSSTDSVYPKSRSPLSRISIHSSRPNFGSLLTRVADETLARHGREMTDPSGVCVTSCGPTGMCLDVRRAVRGLEGWKKRAVGGVELEEEKFGF